VRIARTSIIEIGPWRRELGRLNSSSSRQSNGLNMDIRTWVVCDRTGGNLENMVAAGLDSQGLHRCSRLWREVLFSGKIGR
jgi:hypothetical protein